MTRGGGGRPGPDLECALACMTRPGEKAVMASWIDGPCSLAAGPEATLYTARDGASQALLLDGPLYQTPVTRDDCGDHPLLSALRRRGVDALGEASGDMTCAWWDGETRSLVLARDPSGYRPLFYWTQDDALLFATEPRGLLSDPRVERRTDTEYLGEWLAILPRPSTRSAFAGIHRVPPGFALIWRDGRARLHRYWRPEDEPLLRLRRDEDYAEAVRETLKTSVRDAVGQGGGVGSHLSSGLDSGSVAALAAEVLETQGRRLTVFTAAPQSPVERRLPADRFGDESRLAGEVVARWPNMDHVIVPNDSEPLMRMLDRNAAAHDGPVRNPSHTVWLDGISACAAGRGIEVMLSAGLGNISISYDGHFALAQLLAQGRLVTLVELLQDIHRREGISALSLAARTLEPLLPVGVKSAVRRLMGRPVGVSLDEHSLIHPHVAELTGLRARSDALGGDIRNLFGTDGRGARMAMLDRADHRGLWRAATRRMFGVDLRDPTVDRRVLDLCLAIPEDQFVRGGGFRSLIRRAMRDHLPDAVLEERRRGIQSADWPSGLTQARAELAHELARARNIPASAALLDLDRLETLLQDWPEGAGWSDRGVTWAYLSGLNRAAAVGRFIRQIEGGNA